MAQGAVEVVKMMTWIALIPAYEPEKTMLDLLSQARDAGFEPVVVDDGSKKPEARELFARARTMATVLTHDRNRGKGRALKTGLAYIRENYAGDYVVVTLDADGQHKTDDARRVCLAAQAEPEALVLGSRVFGAGTPLRSRIGNGATRLVYRLTTGVALADTQTGLRAFTNRLLPELEGISGERYEYEMNVLLRLARQEVPIREVPIETIYINNNAGSHFSTVRDSCLVYGEILKFSASSLVGFGVDYGLYSLLLALTGRLILANVCARVVSAGVNFTLNRRVVFKSRESLFRSALQYFALAAAILLANTLLLRILADGLGLNRYGAKLCVEAALFIVSFLVQSRVIFRSRRPVRRMRQAR